MCAADAGLAHRAIGRHPQRGSVLPRVFLNEWRAWQRLPVPRSPAIAGGHRPSGVSIDDRLDSVAAAVTELAHAAMGSRQWDYPTLAADQLSELHATDVAIDAAPSTEADRQRAFIDATRALLAELSRIP